MDDVRTNSLPFPQPAQDREAQKAEQAAADCAVPAILPLPRSPRPRTASELQRWLDMCG